MPVTREFRVLLSDPEATKVLSFTHPPRGVHSVIVRSVTYPYYLPATGEAGELLISCEIPGTPRALTCPHTLITDAGKHLITRAAAASQMDFYLPLSIICGSMYLRCKLAIRR